MYFFTDLVRAVPLDDLEVSDNALVHMFEQYHMRTQFYYRKIIYRRLRMLRHSELLPIEYDYKSCVKANKELFNQFKEIFAEAMNDTISEATSQIRFESIIEEHKQYLKYKLIHRACKDFAKLFTDVTGDLYAINAKLVLLLLFFFQN